jgi:aryl-alcohol dehydrogenase-like predicted oxidoreductase
MLVRVEYRSLGRTGIKISCLGLGTANFGERTAEPEALRIIDNALDAGINVIDTANSYGSRFETRGRGRSEEMIGSALRRSSRRASVILATKVRFRTGPDINDEGLSRRHIIDACDASLRRLQTDWIDIYQVHRPTLQIPIDETLRALDDLVRAGKVRYLGTSGYHAWQIVESLWAAKEYGLNRVVCEQAPYNLLDRTIEAEILPMAHSYGIGVVTWSPLARGYLTGQYIPGKRFPADSRFAWFERHGEPDRANRYFTPQTALIMDAVLKMAAEKKCTPTQLALAWCHSHSDLACTLIGPRTEAQVSESLAAIDIELTEADHALLDGLSPPGSAVVSFDRGYGSGNRAFRW